MTPDLNLSDLKARRVTYLCPTCYYAIPEASALIARCETAERERDEARELAIAELQAAVDMFGKYDETRDQLASARAEAEKFRNIVRTSSPFSAIERLSDELAELYRRIDEYKSAGIHTCHEECKKLECVQGREIERYRKALEHIATNSSGHMNTTDRLTYAVMNARQALNPEVKA